MERKIIFFDIDGTLIEAGKRYIDADVLSAISSARKNGNLCFINTGRTLANLSDHILSAGFDGYICACGTYIMLDGRNVYYHHTSDEICQRVIELSEKYRLDIVYESYHGIYYEAEKLLTPAANALAKALGGVYKLYRSVPENLNFDKFVTWIRDDSDLSGFVSALSEYYECIDRENGFNEFVPKGHSKATGIKFILDRYKLPLSSAYAVGDSSNDLPMLTYVPHSIAMGNSSPESLFDMVEYVTTDISDGGIRKALEHYGFI